MKITKATRWRVFAGVWLQSLFTSATAYFSLFCIPLTTKFGWSDSDFALAYTIYMQYSTAVHFLWFDGWCRRRLDLPGLSSNCIKMVP